MLSWIARRWKQNVMSFELLSICVNPVWTDPKGDGNIIFILIIAPLFISECKLT